MATKKAAAPEPDYLATHDEMAIFNRAIVAIQEAIGAQSYREMAHTEGVLEHAHTVVATMKQRHLLAANAQLAQLLRLRVQWTTDLMHRCIVWDERHRERVPEEERAAVEAEIEQRRELIRQAQALLEAIQ